MPLLYYPPTTGAAKKAAKYPLEIKAVGPLDFFVPKPTFSYLDMLKNPYMLFMGVMLVISIMMPKMMEGMDPEQLKKMQEEAEENNPADLW